MIVEFYTATACPTCRMTKKKIKENWHLFDDVIYREFNVDYEEDMERAREERVQSVPTIIFKGVDGEIKRLNGEETSQIIEELVTLK